MTLEVSLSSRASSLSLSLDVPEVAQPTTEDAQSVPSEQTNSTQFGICGWKIQCLQRLKSPNYFVGIFSLQIILQTCLYSYIRTTSSVIATSMVLSARELLQLNSICDIAPILFSLPLIYHGSRKNGPRWMTIANVMFMFGIIFLVLTIFVPYETLTNGVDIFCSGVKSNSKVNLTQNYTSSTSYEIHEKNVRWITICLWSIGSSLTSLGNCALIGLGATYLDISVRKNISVIYFAIILTSRIIGILAGYSVSTLHGISVNEDSPRWPPWIVLIGNGISVGIITLLISIFPKHLIKPKPRPVFHLQTEDGDISAIEIGAELNNQSSTCFRSFKMYILEFLMLLKEVVSKKPYVWVLFGDFFGFFGAYGYFLWLPKYMESHYRVNQYDTTVYTGISCTSSVIIGVLGGSLYIRQCKPSAKTVVGIMGSTKLVYSVLLIGLAFLTCNLHLDVPGQLNTETGLLNPVFTCAKSCECAKIVEPVCLMGDTVKQSFLSPCHAGCSQQTSKPQFSGSTYYFYNCSCSDSFSHVRAGYCETTCPQLTIYNMMNVASNALISISLVGSILISLRSTNNEQKSIGVSLKLITISLAYVTSQIVYSVLSNGACLLFGEYELFTRDCLFYDSIHLGYIIHGTTCLMFVLSAFCDLMVSFEASSVRIMSKPQRRRRATVSASSRERPKEPICLQNLRLTLLRHLNTAETERSNQRTR